MAWEASNGGVPSRFFFTTAKQGVRTTTNKTKPNLVLKGKTPLWGKDASGHELGQHLHKPIRSFLTHLDFLGSGSR